MSISNRYSSSLRRLPSFLVALVVQLLISILLTPWNAATEAEFYEGAKRALFVALIVHVITRFAWHRLLSATSIAERMGNEVHCKPPTRGAWKFVFQAFAAAMFVALAFAIAIDRGFIGSTTGMFLCVTVQQLAFSTAAFHIQERAVAQNTAGRVWSKLVVICILALYFSRVVPSLFQQIATGVVVQNNPANLAFAMPAILVALIVAIRPRAHRE